MALVEVDFCDCEDHITHKDCHDGCECDYADIDDETTEEET